MARGALLTLGGALFCVVAAGLLSVPYLWLFEQFFGQPEYAMHDTFIVVPDPVILALACGGLTAVLLLLGKAKSVVTTFVFCAALVAALYVPILLAGFARDVTFMGWDAAVLTAAFVWSLLLRRLAR